MQEPKSQSPVRGRPTPYVPNKQPPSGGYAAFSPKGEVLELAIRRRRSAHYALSSGFQLAHAKACLAGMTRLVTGLIEMMKLIRDARNSESINFPTKTFTTKIPTAKLLMTKLRHPSESWGPDRVTHPRL